MAGFGFKKPSGFTLIEIILVVALMTIIAGIAIPNFSTTYQNIILKQAVDELAYAMRLAQSRAVTKSNSLRLVFHQDVGQYWLEEKISEDDQYTRLKGRSGKIFKFSDDFHIEKAIDSIYFSPDGNIDKVNVVICHNEKCYTISTSIQRGYVQVYDFRFNKNENSNE